MAIIPAQFRSNEIPCSTRDTCVFIRQRDERKFCRLQVSKTRGEPSTSGNLKEALREKIPLYHDLLRNFRRHHGPSIINHITVDDLYDGLSGVKTTVRETSEIDPKHGVIIMTVFCCKSGFLVAEFSRVLYFLII